VLVPAVVIALVVAVAVQLRAGPAPWRPPLPEMSPQVVLPELTQPPSTGGPSGSASPSATRRTATTPAGTGGQPAPGATGTAAPGPTIAGGPQPGSIVGSDGRCMEPVDSGRGSLIQVATCARVPEQRWSVPGDRTLRSLGFCLDLLFERRNSGTPVVLSSCDGSSSQQWQLDQGRWRNQRSDRCLTASGGRLTIEDCTGAANQRWSLT
jgi:hypothetical protein